jgi:hypothetical protein
VEGQKEIESEGMVEGLGGKKAERIEGIERGRKGGR